MRRLDAWLGDLLALAGLGAILGLTLFPNPGQAAYAAQTPLFCLVCGDQGGADVFLNLLLFTPMAVGLRLTGWSWRRVVLVSAALSFTVECLQNFVVPGRDASLSDLLTNTAGAAIGAAVAPRFGRLLAPDQMLARHLYFAAVGLWLGVLAFTALTLLPWVPSGRLRNDCTRTAGKADPFTGTARSVVLNGVPIPCDDELPGTAPFREGLSRGEASLDVAVSSRSPAPGRTLIHAVRVPSGYLLVLAQDGNSATFSPPTAGMRLRLYPPILRLAKAFPPSDGIPLRLQAGVRDRRMWITASHPGGQRRVELVLSPSQGWSALLPWGLELGRRLRVVTALWIGGLILPAAYWAGFLRHPAWGLGGIVLALVAGLGVLPSLTGYPPAHWSEWLGGALGVAVGWALPWLAAYLQSRCGSPSTSAYSSP